MHYALADYGKAWEYRYWSEVAYITTVIPLINWVDLCTLPIFSLYGKTTFSIEKINIEFLRKLVKYVF